MKKRALLVGINYEGTGNKLRGCLNDSNNMNILLAARGFTDIKMVLEKDATTEGIIAGLNWLITDVVPGDVIVFHYSGHGSQLPSRVEEDGFEEIICPIDLDWMNKVITDDTLRKIFDTVPNGVNTTLILDCCHSGTMLDQTDSTASSAKDLPAEKGTTKGIKKRFLKPPAKILQSLKKRELVDWETSKDVNATALLIAASHANQTSADAKINGVYQGAATAALIKAVTDEPTITYKNLVDNMTKSMIVNNFSQRPQLDGSPALYNQTFLEKFDFIIPDTPVPQPVEEDSVQQPVGKSSKKTLMIAAGIIVVVIIAAFVLA